MMDFDTKLHVKIRLLSASHSTGKSAKKRHHFFDAIRVDSVLGRRDQDVPCGKAQPCEHTLRLASDGLFLARNPQPIPRPIHLNGNSAGES